MAGSECSIITRTTDYETDTSNHPSLDPCRPPSGGSSRAEDHERQLPNRCPHQVRRDHPGQLLPDIGHIKSDGTVQDASYRTIGHLKSDGTVQDESYRTVGHIKDDGTVKDSNYRTIGHVKSDGTVQDSSFKTIGHAGGIPMKWAAFFFFFSK